MASESELMSLSIDVDEIDDALVRSLRDPARPQHCHQFYAACFTTIGPYNRRLSKKPWPRRHRTLLETMMKFLCAPGVNFESCTAYMNECRCDLSLPLEATMHLAHTLDANLWEIMTTLLTIAINDFTSASVSARSRARIEEHPPWPSSASDLVPYGLEATLDALIEMANRIVPSAFHIIHLLGVIFGAHTVTKLMVNHPLLPAAFYNYLSTWENVIAEIALGRSTGEHATLSAVTAVYKTFQFTADLLGAPLDALRRFAERAGTPRDKFIVQWSQLMESCIRVRASLPTDLLRLKLPGTLPLGEMLEHLSSAYASMGAVFHSALGLGQDERLYHPMILRLTSHSWASLVHRLSATERQAEENPRCFGPGCPETEALLERKLQVCGGCNHMKYCSKECQRQAWKDQIVPHKPICKLIQGLRARGVREPVWAGENIVQAVASMAELYPVFQALADHIDQLAA